MYTKLTRCSHIADLTPEMILALAVTAPFLQVPALRDAICKHVSFRPSVRVHVPVRQFTYRWPSPAVADHTR